MPRHLRPTLLLLTLGLLGLGLAACGSDDDPAKPSGPTDDVAPLVRSMYPDDGDHTVGLTAPISINFTEPMDMECDDVTVTGGGALTFDWSEDGRFVSVMHDAAWSEGRAITCTVGTGMKDLAGNGLPQAFSATFHTMSTVPVLLDTMFPGGADAMVLNGEVVLLFSERMDLTSIADNTTIDELLPPIKAVPGFDVITRNGDPAAAVYRFHEDLTPNTTYRITIDGVALSDDRTPLGDDVVVTFTTGAVADETGPQFLSVSPPVGSVVPTDLEKIVVTFTEPVDPDRLAPEDMSALFMYFMAREPIWNDAGDEITIFMQQPLPQGIRYYAVFSDYNIYDLVGNGNAEPDSLSFTTMGEAEMIPMCEDLRVYLRYHVGEGRDEWYRRTVQNVDGDSFEHVLHGREDDTYSVVVDKMAMTRTATGYTLDGMNVEAGFSACEPSVPFLSLTPEDAWDGSTTLQVGATSVVMSFSAETGEIFRDYILDNKKAPSYRRWLDGCMRLTLDYRMTVVGEKDPFETGELEYYLAPGLGIYYHEFDHNFWDSGSPDGEESGDYEIWGAALDDRHDID